MVSTSSGWSVTVTASSLSTVRASATLLLFACLPLLATPTPDQYGSAAHKPTQLHAVKLQHTGYYPSESLLIPIQGAPSASNERPSSGSHEEASRRVRNTDEPKQHAVNLAKTAYAQSEILHPIQHSSTEEILTDQKNDDPDLQIGCADGSVAVKTESNEELLKKTKETITYEGDDDLTIADIKLLDESLQNSEEDEPDTNSEDNNIPLVLSKYSRHKREAEENKREKRNFIRWIGTSTLHTQPPQQTYISSYQLQSRIPYVIPIWGNPGRIPVFFPYKPILYNPGYPVQNPPSNPRPDFGRPPTEITTENPTATADGGQVVIGNRINVDQEGNPIWGIVESEESSGGSGGSQQRPVFPGNSVATTANPDRPRKPKTPPLLHRPSATNDNQPQPTENTIANSRPPISQNFPPATTRRPQNFPVTTQAPIFRPPNNQAGNFAPPIVQATVPPVSRPQEPSRCVWAVISCCSPLSSNVKYSCFEQLGCTGQFWDTNPCSYEITSAALNAAQRFYEQTAVRGS